MIDVSEVDAIITTRGDVDLYEIFDTLKGFGNIIVWNNSRGPNMGPFGHFLAACYLSTAYVVYMQDDDCLTDPHKIVKEWEPLKIVCNLGTDGHAENYKNRPDKLMGFGSCFETELIKPTFERYWLDFPLDMVTWRESTRIFTGLNKDKTKVVGVPFRNLPWATRSDRMYKQPDHGEFSMKAMARIMSINEGIK